MTAQILLHPSLAPLDGGINFRDLGGNSVADGRRIKRGLLFRSGSLERLTEDDCTFLAGVPVRSVLDYRDADEVQAKPDILWRGADYHHFPANPLSNEVNANLEKLTSDTLAGFDAQAFMLELYRRLPFGNAAYKQLAQLLSNVDNGAIVQHCAVGKDRTGIGSALVLFALGADEATVVEDYLLTETTLATFREQMLDQLSIRLSASALGQFAYVLSAREEFLMTALSCIRDQYGSTDRWLEAEYGLGQNQREVLQAFYLE
ncbi:Tyrosine-protein phosphatase precursor [Serratia quinivorans]|uniref:tyrosine-protein phosphatase n=1 Tax=Serratia quinivorans TaxID=137545 RepID=UPI00217A2BD9|nr:tyrosine-protein phosphatase [Serratia quinivorans]CAI1084119.1 Tyrosine-protein phosphatase precursor [Serratia quinivorans]CAI1238265.1 Tyrosine-protein phosphatase precursor [Serratia quinivorans]CAI1932257.1 Tyrosine-protein phosphatase precursor [Serratia quinivorans]CAI2134624.1 Tyrosine-protein phosphatase precursor [Serratia quinivorans]CAI2518770.1 Tyrosine-protein phosphatase precursor [Serratia quinivorans]